MRIRDGCATVTGYELPQATVRRGREGGSEVQAPSQDIGLTALVGSERIGALLRKEKDEAGPPDRFWRNSSNAFIPRFAELKAFLFISSSSSSS